MKTRKKLLMFGVVIATMIFALAVAACTPKVASNVPAAVSYPVGSLLATHADGVLEADVQYSKKDCLSCHPRDAIIAANENYGGAEGVNPHAAHTEAYECTKCHSVTDASVMVCNGCHSWALPEGWENAPNTTNSSLGN
jgi:hypothetical protein